MKVKFKREGGFAGMTVQKEVDDHVLPLEAKQALNVIRASVLPAQSTRRDAYMYTIEFERNNQPIVVALPEEHVPTELAPLIHYFESSTGPSV